MRSTSLLIPAFLLALAGCNEEPELRGFGEACEPEECAEGLTCYIGYCEETCSESADCSPVDGWVRECHAGTCHIVCDDQGACPQTLGTPLECGIEWCAAKEES